MRCIEVNNLLYKNKLECNFHVKDKYKFMYNMLEYQPKNITYSYKFDDGDKFVVCHGDNDDFMIEKINSDLHMKIIEHICDLEYHDPNKRMDSIINNLTIISEKYNMPLKFNKEQITNIINKLNKGENKNKILESRDQYLEKIKKEHITNKQNINQQGGFLIWLIEKYGIDTIPNDTIKNILWGTLEIIDIILLVLQAIPGLQLVYGAGFIIDAIAIIYSFLRLDPWGMVGGVVSIIPIVGDILGVIIRIIGKIKAYTKRFKAGAKVAKSGIHTGKDVIRDTRKGQLSLSSFKGLADIPANLAMAAAPKSKRGRQIMEGLTTAAVIGQTAIGMDEQPKIDDMQQYELERQQELQQALERLSHH